MLNSLSALPRLAKVLGVPVPRLRKPGSAWTELSRSLAARTETAGHVRNGYARASTVRQSLDAQTDALKAAGITRIFAEKISTRAKVKPELDRTLTLACELRSSGVAVTIVIRDHKRLGRGIELAQLTEQLRAGRGCHGRQVDAGQRLGEPCGSAGCRSCRRGGSAAGGRAGHRSAAPR
ncbi:recombinase family protein [Actinomadura coerulea]|uniref:recombinase family protein n=1 Tax=Actinomadura coerulea TaxID=46159 RepID=UPI003431448C